MVEASRRVAATPSRKQKVAVLAELLAATPPTETPMVVGMLTGEPRQGRIGVGHATVFSVDAPPAEAPSLGVGEVDEALERLAGLSGPGSQEQRRRLLARLLGRATAEEQELIRRLLVGEVRQGALEGVMVEAVAVAAGVPVAVVRRALMLHPDLGEVARRALEGGEAALSGIGLQVLQPVQPMLAQTARDVADALQAVGRASVEWKLDGARIQVHKAGGEVLVVTRRLNPVTERLPAVVEVVAGLPVERVILDGEAMALDSAGGPRPFHETMSRFGTEEVPSPELVPFFFDLLHLDGTDLIDRPLEERLRLLDEITPPANRIPRVVTERVEDAERVLAEARRHGHEGVMVKAADSVYEAGRRGAAWRKVKPAHNLDLVVLAAEWGHGRRTGYLSNLHLGARDPAGGFVMLGKTFKGLTDEMLRWQTERLLQLEERRTASTVYVRPQLVVEVAFDGVQPSPRYPGGVALRFARVKGYRPDKAPADADTIDAVRSLAAYQG